MTGIIVRPGESFEKALRRFSKKVELADILGDLKSHERYEKPSEKKKRKKNIAIRNAKKEQRLAMGSKR